MNTNYVISLEIGSSAAKIGAASFDADLGSEAPVTVIAIEEEPLTNCVRYGRIQNVEDVTRHTMLALDQLNGRTGVYPRKVTGVYTAIGGRSLASCKASASLTLPEESEITNDIIERLKNDAMLQVPQGRIALDVIPLKYTVDEIVTNRPVGSFGTRIKAEFTIVFCDPLNERNLERVIVERLDLDICGYVVRPLAIANLALTHEETKPGCMLVDLGAETTTVAIFKDGALQYLATIPLGSHNITRDLASGLGVVEEQAEKIKVRLGNAISDSATLTREQIEIDNYVQARVTEIIANILAHIGFAGFKSSDLCSGIIITGRGAKLRNFCQLLQSQSRLQVRVATIPGNIYVADPAINPNDNIDLIAVAYEAMNRSLHGNAVPCVTDYKPAPEPEPEVVQPEPEIPTAETKQPEVEQTQPEEPAQPVSSIYEYTGGTFGGYTDNETPADQPADEPSDTNNDGTTDDNNDKYLLLDSEEENRRKQLLAKKAKEDHEKALAAEAKRREKERQRLSRPGFYDRIKTRLKNLIDDNGDGYDLDEDNDLD
jgi:cell division protein FtsA